MEKKKRIVVLGAGESGVGAAVLAQVKGFDVFVSDMSVIQDKYKEQLDRYEIPFEEGKHTPDLILNADEVVKSPGIPDRAPKEYSYYFGNRVCRSLYSCPHDLHYREQWENDDYTVDLSYSEKCRIESGTCR